LCSRILLRRTDMLPVDIPTWCTRISADRMSNKNSFELKYEKCTLVERVLHYFSILLFYIIITICVSFERPSLVTDNNNNNNNNMWCNNIYHGIVVSVGFLVLFILLLSSSSSSYIILLLLLLNILLCSMCVYDAGIEKLAHNGRQSVNRCPPPSRRHEYDYYIGSSLAHCYTHNCTYIIIV